MSIKNCIQRFQIPQIMAVLNLTEDSFSDGGYYLAPSAAVDHAMAMLQAGAQILDIGAESTRPGSREVDAKLEWQRIQPVLVRIRDLDPNVRISIDTQKAEVAEQAIALGADIINDISALQYDTDMAGLIAAHPQVKVILMHMQGRPQTMQNHPQYDDVLAEVSAFLQQRAEYAISQGIARENIILDPGIGFGKNLQHNLSLLARLDTLSELGYPILLGASRKSFIDRISTAPANQRIGGSLATTILACLNQADIIRVHDVQIHRQFLDVFSAILEAGA
ncbi:MAG: dihydropteroate synthase [Candidatus Cloacimonadaceae bacterium]|jgi:dihydropteroate synthase|nr:dihydropteroate synthase [Candidatus Cloacimonadota bacterium]MDY0126551.1 dihydropteroate synthase [Candidatus Cloacimonadaceae bacterium]MCB5254641.1 dihydropteroate synthase [Candidatus Cloacimonadota bacterium]MCK9177728.1 dihydropteroate synthase [Candidatus Cloacimonadota bacterium]MCK9241902.1 dihydropteroate synthase [Candidatus Cloacimonadota bacterium]